MCKFLGELLLLVLGVGALKQKNLYYILVFRKNVVSLWRN